MIQWVLEHLGIVIVAILFISQMVRGVLQQARQASEQQEKQRDGTSEDQRVREVQEKIRRQIAARRAGHAPSDRPPPLAREPARPIPRAETTQMPDFGGPFGRMLEELQRKAQQHVPPPPPVLLERDTAVEVERQQRLAEELKVVEEARQVARRKAAHVAADQLAFGRSEAALRKEARNQLLNDLADRQSLRRAFVLREVLGPPVGLR